MPDERAPQTWNDYAAAFDDMPDHALTDPGIRAHWQGLIVGLLPPAPARILDVGCGTGSVSLLLAEMHHRVTGIDFAAEMIDRARAKAALFDADVSFAVDDASAPSFAPHTFEVVICRHVLWALPDGRQALTNWRRLLAPGGHMVFVEG